MMATVDDRRGLWSRLSLFGAIVAAGLGVIALADTCRDETIPSSDMANFCCVGNDRVPLEEPLFRGAVCIAKNGTGQACK